jgi:hypothetical protein
MINIPGVFHLHPAGLTLFPGQPFPVACSDGWTLRKQCVPLVISAEYTYNSIQSGLRILNVVIFHVGTE